jgi:hypothetical protein
MRKLCRRLITEINGDSLTVKILYGHIAARAHKIFLAELLEETKHNSIAGLKSSLKIICGNFIPPLRQDSARFASVLHRALSSYPP